MTTEGVVAIVWAAAIAVSLASIVAYFLLWTGVIALTAMRARHRTASRSELLTSLARQCAVSDLEDIDDAFRRVLAEERGRDLSRKQG